MKDGYSNNIRDFMPWVIGRTVVDISQHDPEDYDRETGEGAFVMLLFDDGSFIKFPVSEAGFMWEK